MVISIGSFGVERGDSNWAASSCTVNVLLSDFLNFSGSSCLTGELGNPADFEVFPLLWETNKDFAKRGEDPLVSNLVGCFPADAWLDDWFFVLKPDDVFSCLGVLESFVLIGDAEPSSGVAVKVHDLAVSSSTSFSCSFSNSNINRERDSVGVYPWDSLKDETSKLFIAMTKKKELWMLGQSELPNFAEQICQVELI